MEFNMVVRSIINDVREEYDIEIEEVSHKAISVYDDIDGYSHRYTIHNVKYMDRKFIEDRLLITKSAENLVNREAIISYVEKLPKYIYCNLDKIIIINDGEDDDFEEVESVIGRDVLEMHDFPYEGQLGIMWSLANMVVISMDSIKEETEKMVEDGDLYDYEATDCINWGLCTTLVHELRHLAQNNPYLPAEILKQEGDEEEDAENFANDFCNSHIEYLLAE